LFTEKAVDIIQNHDPSKPLFLYLPYQAVHSANYIQPLQAPPDEIKKFSNIQDENRRIFAATVSSLDQGVGKVSSSLHFSLLPYSFSSPIPPSSYHPFPSFITSCLPACLPASLPPVIPPSLPFFLPACLTPFS